MDLLNAELCALQRRSFDHDLQQSISILLSIMRYSSLLLDLADALGSFATIFFDGVTYTVKPPKFLLSFVSSYLIFSGLTGVIVLSVSIK